MIEISYGTGPVRPSKVMVRGWCDHVNALSGIDAICYADGVIPPSHSMWFLRTVYTIQQDSFSGFYVDQNFLHKGRPSIQEKPPALKSEHPAFQNISILHFFVGYFCPPGSGSSRLKFNADP